MFINFKKYLIYYEKLQCFTIMFIVSPGFYSFHMAVIFPTLLDIYQPSRVKIMFYVILSLFFFVNIMGNMMMSVCVDSSCKVRGFRKIDTTKDGLDASTPAEAYCRICKIIQPPKAWHCSTCNACIVRRDHHCFFFSRCIGLHNQRYYLLWLFYVAVSVTYLSYHDYFYFQHKFNGFDLLLSVLSILDPLVRLSNGLCYKDMFTLFFMFNCSLVAWAFGLFVFHMRNVINGVTAYESSRTEVFDRKWENLKLVFGSRWFIAVVWPFAFSPVCDSVKET